MSESLVTAKRESNATRVTFGANLDVASANELKKALTKIIRRKPPFNLDGGAIERIDTAGLQVLLSFMEEIRGREIELQWDKVSETLQTAARLLGLDAKLDITVES